MEARIALAQDKSNGKTRLLRMTLDRIPAPALSALGLLLFLLIWEAAPALGLVPASVLPPPSALPRAFIRELQSGIWFSSLVTSLRHYLAGLAIGCTLGVGLGVATGMFRPLEAFLGWVVRVLRPIPGLAWVPFAILWFGIEPSAAIFIIAVGVFWISYFAALSAVRAVDRDLIEVADAFDFRRPDQKLLKVILPAAAPGILAGLRTALGQAWMAVVAAEIFGVPGLGQRMTQAANLLASDVVVIYMATMAALYGIIDLLFVAAQNRALRWKR
ncbi:MAG: sulfonate transport system permease protein [Variibacter sp.]|nr:sulfonate transport system permease protein [Variibacter sp.]